ncbi:MAG: hypothetical protein ACOZAR_01815 [Patescibacteria group bacterium]
MKIPKIKKLLQFTPMVLLCLALVVVLILKVRIPTTSKEISVNTKEQTQSMTDKQAESDQSPTAGKKKMSVTTNISKIEIAPVVDEKQQKYLYNEAVEAIINVDRIRNDDSTLPSDNAFSKKKDKQYWWDLINWFGKEVVEAKNDDFTLKNYLDANQIRTEVQLTEEQKDFAVSLEVPNSKTVTSSRGDFIQYEFDQSTVVQYQLKNNRLKENIIYNFKPAENYFYFNIDRADNLEIIPKPDGEIIIQTKDEPRHIVATVMAPTVVDRKGKVGKISLEYSENRYKYIIDQAWLDQANYPVVIDPSLQLGAVLYYTGGTVNVEWHGDGSDYRDTGVFLYKDEVSLYSPINQYLISNIDYGDCNPAVGVFQLCNKGTTSFNLGDQYVGQELKFGNKVYQSDIIYYTGPASRNPDNQVHTIIVYEESFNAYVIRFLRNHPTKNGMWYGPSVDIWLTGGLSDSPPPVDPTPTTSPEPILSNLSCVSNSGQITVNFDTTGFGSTATYAIKFVGNGTQYLQSNNTLGDTEVWRTKGEWGNNIRVTGLTAGTDYTVSISAKPDGAGTALAYGPTKNTTEICSQDTFNDSGQVCGDGVIQFPEECDDGNTNDGDGCDRNCTNEPAAVTDPPTVDIKANGSDSPSTLPNNSTVTLSWTSSNATSCTASGSWSGDKATNGSENQGPLTTGTYTYVIQCTNSAGSRSDSVTITIFSPPCDITYTYSTTNTDVNTVSNHWHGTVCINRNLFIAGSNTLTIDPGTVIKFYVGNANERWRILNYGTLNAIGTEDNPIYFTSFRDNSIGNIVPGGSGTPQKGEWNELNFNAYGDSYQGIGELNNVVIRYATTGINDYVHTAFSTSPHKPEPILRNIIIENCSGDGIYIERSHPILENVTIRNNGGNAIYLNLYGYSNSNGRANVNFLGNNVAINNKLDGIYVNNHALSSTAILENITWNNDFPYYLAQNFNIERDAILSIEKGTVIKSADDVTFTVWGTLVAIGTVDEPVYFTSAYDNTTPDGDITPTNGEDNIPTKGDWAQLIFLANRNDADQANGELNNVIIRYAVNGINDYVHTTYVSSPDKPEPILRNILIENCSGSGVNIDRSHPILENITIKNCYKAINLDLYGITSSDGRANVRFLGKIVAENNEYNGVYVYNRAHSPAVIQENISWDNNLPYYLGGSLTINPGISLTLSPGTIIKIGSGYKIENRGLLYAVGSSEQPIFFTSAKDNTTPDGDITPKNTTDNNPTKGDWNEIMFNAYNNNYQGAGELNNVIIRYSTNGINDYTHILYQSSLPKQEPVLRNITIEKCSASGISIQRSHLIIDNASISDCDGNAVSLDMYGFDFSDGRANISFTGTTSVSGNGLDGIYVFHSTNNIISLAEDITWEGTIPYYVSETIEVPYLYKMTIQPGTILKFGSAADLHVLGRLNIGDQNNIDIRPVYMTSIKDDSSETGGDIQNNAGNDPSKGDWGKLIFDAYNNYNIGAGEINNLIIRYATIGIQDYVHHLNANDLPKQEPVLKNIIIENCSSHGISVDRSHPIFENLIIRNNNSNAVNLDMYGLSSSDGKATINFVGNVVAENNGLDGIYIFNSAHEPTVIIENVNWDNDLPYYIANNLSVYSSSTLNIESGTVIKFGPSKSLTINGKLNLNGTSEKPIYLTSSKDNNTPDGDITPLNFSDNTPAKEDWGGVLYSGSSAGGKVYNTTFRYGAGGTGNYDYELAFDGVTANTVEVKNSNFNFTNRGLYANNSKLSIHDNIFDSSSDYGVVINNPPTGFVFDRNEIAHSDTGIWITAASNGLTLSNNNIHDVLTGVLGQNISTNGVLMTGNYIDASNYLIRNNSSPFVSGSCASPSTSTTINACVANNWGSYPVSDYPTGKIYKNPGNILYNNYGVQLTAPNGGERWSPRSRHNIIWTTYNTGGNSRYADLHYSFDGGTNWTLIAENIDHQGGATIFGTYDWLIPDTVSAQTLVKVDIKDLNETIIASDVSNSYFVIGYGDPQLSDTISTAHTGRPAHHTILYTNDITNSYPVSDGSLKFDLADEFDFTGLTIADLSIRGGDVSWGVPTLDPISRSIIYSFSGNLSKNDGSIILTIGDTNLPLNPTLAGDYRLTAGIYQTTDGTGNPVEEVETLININDGLTIEVDIPTTLEFAINPLPSGSNVNGAATNVATAASAIDYGRVTGGENKIAAHELVFSTNCADGYLAQIKYSGPFSGPVAINDWTGTNSEPTVWLAPNNNGYFGYTTDNATLKNGQANRFVSGGGNKWSRFTTDFNEVAADSEPVENQTTKVGYRFNLANNFGTSGVYQTEIMYLVTTSY